MTTVYEETVESGRHVHRLVVADVYNPSSYEVLTQAGKYVEQPCFGPVKRRLLYEDHEGARTDSDAQITLFDLDSGAVRPLIDSTEGRRRPILGQLRDCVWSADGGGFYYRAYAGSFPYQAYYDLETRKSVPPFPQTDGEVFVKARMDGDTLVVSSGKARCHEAWNEDESSECSSFFLMTFRGRYLTHLNTPYFTLTEEQGIYNFAWTHERNLFALTYNDTTSTGWKLAATNRSGSHWVTTSGQYADALPSWGPDGQFLLFDRRGRRELASTAHRVMWLDPYSGAVRRFVEPETIDGAVALSEPDY